jgi:hypothetical protein
MVLNDNTFVGLLLEKLTKINFPVVAPDPEKKIKY